MRVARGSGEGRRLRDNDDSLAEYATERRVFVPISVIPKRVISAFLATEDKNFYSHHGIDPIAMLRAAVTDIGKWRGNRRPVGASTITQQVAKNMLLSNELSFERKIKEVLLATRIDEALPKDRILELYLNEIYLGGGAYGVASAALTYFNKSLDELTLAEAAFLAGLPKAPNNYNPKKNQQAARNRRDLVLDQMVEAGYATPAEAAAAKADPVIVRHREEAEIVTGAYFAEEVRRQLLAQFGEKAVYQGGLTVRTSLDARLQAAADKSLREGLIAYDRAQGGWRGVVDHIDPTGDWPATLAAQPLPAGAGSVGWQLAMVTHTDGEGRQYRLQGRLDRAHPVRADALGPAAARRRHDRRLAAQRRRRGQAGRSGAGRAAGAGGRQARAGGTAAAADQQSRDDAGSAAGPVRGIVQFVPDPRHFRRAGLDRPAYRAGAGDERRVQL